jgi:predicted nucleic acid-binding Zn ribbon protein
VPFYEYRRPDGTILEVMQKMTDPPLAEDPETGVPLERVFHPIAVHFKGKGFYNTDYGTKKRQRENAKSEESKKAETAKTETKSGDSSSSGGDSSSSGGSSSESVSSATPKTETKKSSSDAGASSSSKKSD